MVSELERQLYEALLDLKRFVVRLEQGQSFGEYPNKMKVYDAIAAYEEKAQEQNRVDY